MFIYDTSENKNEKNNSNTVCTYNTYNTNTCLPTNCHQNYVLNLSNISNERRHRGIVHNIKTPVLLSIPPLFTLPSDDRRKIDFFVIM